MNAPAKKTRAGRSADVQAAIKVGDYEPPFGQSLTHRAAHFLDWAAQHYPQEYVPYNFIVRAIQGYNKTPRLDTEEVESLRRALSRIGRILQQKFKRGKTTSPGQGVRATTNDVDAVKTEIRNKMVRLQSAKVALEQSASIVDPTRMPAGPEKKWFTEDVGAILKTLKSPSFEARFALPAAIEPPKPKANDEKK